MSSETLQITTDIILVDVVEYSLLSDEDQLRTVEVLQTDLTKEILFVTELTNLRKQEVVIDFVTTGDGMYILVNPQVCGYGIALALSIRNHLLWLSSHQSNAVYRGIRVGVHTGTVLSCHDINGFTNYVGAGMNDCARLLAVSDEDTVNFCGDKNYVVASEMACYWFQKLFSSHEARQFLSIMKFRLSNLCKIIDKHKKVHNAYLVEAFRLGIISPPNFVRPRKRGIMGFSN